MAPTPIQPTRPAAPVARKPVVAPAAPAAAATTKATAGVAPKPISGLKAAERMKIDRPKKFKNPDEYKNYVIKFNGYMAAAKGELARAEQERTNVRELKSVADVEWRRPLDAATQAWTDTDRLYAAPVADAEAALASARQELDDAINPGRRHAVELEAEAAKLTREGDGLESQLGTAKTRLAGQDARIQAQRDRKAIGESDRTRYEAEVRELEGRVPAGTTIERQLSDARAASEDAGRRRADAQGVLDRAKAADQTELAELDRRVRDLEGSVASAEREVKEAKDVLATADGAIARETAGRDRTLTYRRDAEADIQRLEPQASPSALEAARSRATQSETRAKEAETNEDRAEERVTRKNTLTASVEAIGSAKETYQAASRDRSSAKTDVDARKRELEAAQAGTAELEAQRKRVRDAEAEVSRADTKNDRKVALLGAVDQLAALTEQLDHAENSRAGFKGQVTRKQNELDAAMDGPDPSKVTPARSALAEAQQKWADADAKVKAIESRLAQFGGAGSLSSKKSEAAALGDTAGELARANSNLASEKQKLAGYADVERKITAAKSAHDEAQRRWSDADTRVDRAVEVLQRQGATPDNADAILSQRRSELSSLSNAPYELDRAKAAKTEARDQATRDNEAYQRQKGLADDLADARSRREVAVRDVQAYEARIAALIAEKARKGSELPGAESRLSAQHRSLSSARDAASRERDRQGGGSWLATERNRLDDAARVDERAKATLQAVSSLHGQIATARENRDEAGRTVRDAEAQTGALTAEKAQLPKTIEQLTAGLATKRRSAETTAAEAKKERDRRNGDGHPQVVTAKSHVEAATKRLEAAKVDRDAKVKPLREKVDAEKTAYEQRMGELNARIAAAGPAVETAKQGVEDVRKEFQDLRTAVGGMQRFWWKLVHHFDMDAFWKQHGGLLEA